MRIVLIGPVYPYKGGISHYTGLMCRELRKHHDVHLLSYKLQYPRFLFKKEQKDYANKSFQIEDTNFFINTIDPLNWFATAKHIRKLQPDLVILQWWHPYFAPCYATICRLLGKTKKLFVCHNVFPHERFPMDRCLTKSVLRKGNLFVVHSAQDEEDLKSIKADAVMKESPLPTYNAFKMHNLTREQARETLKLPLEEKVLLFFGLVREYKGLRYLLQAMPEITDQLSGIRLMIVGDFAGEKEQYQIIIDKLNIAANIEIHDGYIPDEEVEKYFAACDLVVLPYTSATQSAVVQVAYGLERPVVVTNVGGLPETVIEGKTGYVVPPCDPNGIAKAVVSYFAERDTTDFTANIRQEAYKFSWERMAETIETLASVGALT